MLSMIELEDWLADSAASKTVVYHVGHLAKDRLRHEYIDGQLREVELEPLHTIASRLYDLMEQGRVLLFQHRITNNTWEYIALRKGNHYP